MTDRLKILKLRAEATNCRRLAESNVGSVYEALVARATSLDLEAIEEEHKENNNATEEK